MPFQSNPRWVLDEWILSLEIYLKNKEKTPSEQRQELEEHSQIRQHLGVLLGHEPAKQENYRNLNGLQRQQVLLVKIEQGNRDDPHVTELARRTWDRFHNRPESLRKACDAIYASLYPFIGDSHRRDGVLPREDSLSSLHPEGFYITHQHLAHDKPMLRDIVSGRMMKEQQQDFVLCARCEKEHGGREINELHCHYNDEDQTNLLLEKEFNHRKYSLFCGSCHAQVHEQKPWINLRFQQLTL